MILAHADQPPAPHDLWMAWATDPVVLVGWATVALVFVLGGGRMRRLRSQRRRTWAFAGGMAALAVALVSPLDALSEALASAHMVQHLLLALVAAPLLALGRPWPVLFRGSPRALRRALVSARRTLGWTGERGALLRHPVTAWTAYVGTFWFWHAAGPYGTALSNGVVHLLEHASFLGAGVLFWAVILESARSRRISAGAGVLLLFLINLPLVFLSALMTFAESPWYDAYAETTEPWGLTPLADQQLAGVLMWIPGGMLYLISALTLLALWIRAGDEERDLMCDSPWVRRPRGPGSPAGRSCSVCRRPAPPGRGS